MRFSEKQLRLARFWSRPGQYVAVSGVTRSGKSESALAGFCHGASKMFSGHSFVLAAQNQTMLDNNVLAKVNAWCERNGLVFESAPGRKKTWRIPSALGGFNYFIEVLAREGARKSAKAIQGAGLAGAYIDDAGVCSDIKNLIEMLDSRMLEVENSKLVFTCNPEGPRHPLKMDYIDRISSGELSGEVFYFGFPDNPALTVAAVQSRVASFSGPFYERMILGRWVASSGVVHPVLPDTYCEPPSDEPVMTYDVALDYGHSGVSYGCLVATYPSGYWVVDEWRHDGETQGVLLAGQQAEACYRKFCGDGQVSVENWLVPKDADGMTQWFHDRTTGNVRLPYQLAAHKYDWTNMMIEGRDGAARVRISPGCVHLARDLDSLVWKEDPMRRGEYIPDKASADGAHCSDAFEYWCATMEAVRRGVVY